ncbi:MAG: hypothetical protein JO261_06625 [Alphaproteobacteria bacterium]|nr:hypothetical protein [Alphaproteobacteria bacterium]MBV9693359.1 hypothetical protein [Alphaproteobacteria bacterium]
MRTLVSALTAAAIGAGALSPAVAAPVCLTSYLIDHSSVKDPQTLLFYMKDGSVYANHLLAACPGLNFHGYVMNIRGGNAQICSNQESISVLVTHEVCQMGAFTPYEPAAKTPTKG